MDLKKKKRGHCWRGENSTMPLSTLAISKSENRLKEKKKTFEGKILKKKSGVRSRLPKAFGSMPNSEGEKSLKGGL